jgi:hypothetical protein
MTGTHGRVVVATQDTRTLVCLLKSRLHSSGALAVNFVFCSRMAPSFAFY